MQNSVDNIRDMIFSTLRNALGKPIELSDQTNIVNDLGLDSVAVMDFVMEIEDQLDVFHPARQNCRGGDAGDLVRTVQILKESA